MDRKDDDKSHTEMREEINDRKTDIEIR